ncbi:MAG TPA: SCP2 sterol-binding domain-containing protein [Gammaproteobacteria bacterium]
MPEALSNRLFVESLNKLFANELNADEFDFMADKIVAIRIDDAKLHFAFCCNGHQFKTADKLAKPDLVISGSAYHFLLLASRREDPDTLFFNRQLRTTGDTELGLYVKNFLDALDLTGRWKALSKLSLYASRFAERIG